jgi:hypothetical protein
MLAVLIGAIKVIQNTDGAAPKLFKRVPRAAIRVAGAAVNHIFFLKFVMIVDIRGRGLRLRIALCVSVSSVGGPSSRG